MAIDRIPLPPSITGRLFATGFRDVGPDPDGALTSVEADVLLTLLTGHDMALRHEFPGFRPWVETNQGGRSWWFPIEDGGVAADDEMRVLVRNLVGRLRRGQHVVTHCGAGIGRTSLACGLAVVVLANVGLDEALAIVRAARSGAGPENPTQRAHLERLATDLLTPR